MFKGVLILIIMINLFGLSNEFAIADNCFDCKVIGVADGDTFYCEGNPKKIGIRVWGINTEELKDNDPDKKLKANQSKRYLEDILFDKKTGEGKLLSCIPIEGSFKRIVAKCFIKFDLAELIITTDNGKEQTEYSDGYYSYLEK